MKKICFVCMGNTCRSPMAEKIFNQLLKQKNIKGLKAVSAGLSCVDGQNMEIKAKRAIKKLGFSCGAKKTCKLVNLEKNTLYITMTNEIKSYLKYPNVLSFEDFNLSPVPDPYQMDQEYYDKTAVIIEQNIRALIDKITKYL